MTDPASVLLVLGVLAAGAYLSSRGRRKIQAALKRSFDSTTFDTPEGRVPGTLLKVVKISKQTMRFAGDDVYQLGRDPMPNDAFWYCVGPGPSYFLALPSRRSVMVASASSGSSGRLRSSECAVR